MLLLMPHESRKAYAVPAQDAMAGSSINVVGRERDLPLSHTRHHTVTPSPQCKCMCETNLPGRQGARRRMNTHNKLGHSAKGANQQK